MDDDMLWNGSEEDGNVRTVQKMKALTVKMETVTVIGKGRENLTCSVFLVCEINSKIYFLSSQFFWVGGGVSS
jgi:hypothetical protein